MCLGACLYLTLTWVGLHSITAAGTSSTQRPEVTRVTFTNASTHPTEKYCALCLLKVVPTHFLLAVASGISSSKRFTVCHEKDPGKGWTPGHRPPPPDSFSYRTKSKTEFSWEQLRVRAFRVRLQILVLGGPDPRDQHHAVSSKMSTNQALLG